MPSKVCDFCSCPQHAISQAARFLAACLPTTVARITTLTAYLLLGNSPTVLRCRISKPPEYLCSTYIPPYLPFCDLVEEMDESLLLRVGPYLYLSILRSPCQACLRSTRRPSAFSPWPGGAFCFQTLVTVKSLEQYLLRTYIGSDHSW